MKTEIFTFVFNRPDLLEYQISSLKKFFIGEYKINVIYDSRDESNLDKFQKICNSNDVNFYSHASQPGNSPSFYNGQVVKWAYDNIFLKDDENSIMLILDHDIFLIDYFDLENEMNDVDVVGLIQKRGSIEYLWCGLIALKKYSVCNIDFDFYPQFINNEHLDSGGGTYKLLNNPNIKFFDTGVEYPDKYNNLDLDDENVVGKYKYELHFNNKFFHFRNASNWHKNYTISDQEKTNLFYDIIEDIIHN